jgi:hypothetical protein
MHAIQIPRVQAVAVLHVMSSGRTKPCLALCANDNGGICETVIKWRGGSEMNERGLICELMTALLANDLDLPVPEPFIVEVAPNFMVGESKSELANIAKKSAGLNFGCKKLPSGVNTWPKDKPISASLRPLAAEIFAFDVLTQNPDRRRDSPNLLWAATSFNENDLHLHGSSLRA